MMEEANRSALPHLNDLIEQLKKLPDFKSRLQLLLLSLDQKLTPLIASKRKRPEESVELRREADKLLVKQKSRNRALLGSLILYTKSIAFAEAGSVELSQAYANRSACLFHLHRTEECIRDIDRALELPYPDHLKPNLLRRKAKCLKLLGNSEAEKVCEEARCLLENMTLDEVKKEKLEDAIDKAAKVAEKKPYKYPYHELPSFARRKDIPSASEAIDLTYSEDMGRYFVANRDIAPGEILIVEKPYLLYLDPDNAYTHCAHCFIRTWDSIPCEHCVHAIYCSEKCKSDAWKSYHDVECILKEYFIGVDMNSMGPLSLKLTLTAVREFGSFEKLRKELDSIDKCEDYLKKMYSEDGILHSDQFRPIYNLLTHESKRDLYEILVLTFNTAVILYYINMYTDLFQTNDKSSFFLCENDDAYLFGKLFKQNYLRCQVNGHEFGELKSNEILQTGATIGCVSSLLNHSCNPNAFRTAVMKNNIAHLVIFSLQPISKGAPIFDDYGCSFLSQSKKDRIKYLEPYHFKCSCDACTKSWTILADLPSVLLYVNDKKIRTAIARSIIQSLKWRQTICYNGFDDYVENINDITEQLTSTITFLSEITKEPSKDYYELLELFRMGISKFYGCKFEL